ncbi:MAG: tellurite resistance TerB family protein [Pseudomonadota bacterium]
MEDETREPAPLFKPLTAEQKPAFSLKTLVSEFPDHQSDWTIPEAFLCLILSAAFADGEVSAEEQEEIRAIAHRSRTLKSMDANELAEANRIVLQRRKDRPDWLGEACEALPREMHLSVFAHCLDITLADGALVPAEAAFLEQLVAVLGILPGDAELITKVLTMKNRY